MEDIMSYRLPPILFSSALLAFSSFSFAAISDQNVSTDQNNAYSSAPATNANAPEPTSQNPADAQKRDGQILGIIQQIDKNEINSSDKILSKTTNPEIKNFAEHLKNDHNQNLQDLQNLSSKNNINVTSSNKSEALERKGNHELEKFDSAQPNQLDKEYLHAMIKGHKAALRAINEELLPKATNPEVKDFLKNTANAVSQHLEVAKNLVANKVRQGQEQGSNTSM